MKKILTVLSVILLIAMPVNAKEVDPVTLKLAFLSGFAKFTQWQESKDQLNICYVTEQDIDPKIALLEGKVTPNGRIHVIAVSSQQQPACDVFIANGISENSTAYLKRYAKKDTLVICNECNVPDVTDIILYRKRNRLAFDVHLGNVQNKPFKFSSNLLELATEVKK